jgi:superfamily II DNA or RNA helicase
MTFKLHPFQKETVDNCIDHYSENGQNKKNGILLLPCGTGKTIIAHEYIKESKSKDTLIVLPRYILIEQFVKTIKKNNDDSKILTYFNSKENFMITFKSNIITHLNRLHSGIKSKNSNILTAVPTIVTTKNKESIEDWLCATSNDSRIIFCIGNNFDSLNKIMNSYKINFDLCIIDEYHHFGNERYTNLLTCKNIKNRLLMSATMPHVTNIFNRLGIHDKIKIPSIDI